MNRRAQAWLMAVLMIVASIAAAELRPTQLLRTLPKQWLEQAVPARFGDWQLDTSIVPVAPDPTVQAAVDRIYTDVLSRTYVNNRGERMMLLIAYGQQQNDSLRVHQPEGCYGGQGFVVGPSLFGEVDVAGRTLPVRRLVATLGLRVEPITYWMTVGNELVLTGWDAKRAQLKSGLLGQLPDGLLFRVSSIDGNADAAYRAQQGFLDQLLQATPAPARAILTGQGGA
ncbi:exosortase-associated protein EpsI, B-type [Jeongeupia sp. USM3]|uniref:exosortase-associated protein EpsI, B-type n=1 Tax=Jeongeupia sp. USM3 TaxID=1906741 RepID=UPI00089E035C|nr:exosortase-associated protein EpsI, B-type [Jeongeupia sp. USM3]AOY01888.1 EpsI family protein [Jeongeupia sp. USM3]